MSWLLFVVATVLVLLSVWIVVPAPAIWAVALSIATSELSPLFLIAAIVIGALAWRFGGSMRVATMTLSVIAAALCLLPIVRYPSDAPFSFKRLVRGLEAGDATV